MSAAGPLPRRSHRSLQGEGTLMSAATGSPKQALAAVRSTEVS